MVHMEYYLLHVSGLNRYEARQSHRQLTHWGRMMHICVRKLTIIGWDNGLSPGRRQAIIWTNAGILLISPLGTNFNEILIGIHTFSFKKMHLKMSSAKWRPLMPIPNRRHFADDIFKCIFENENEWFSPRISLKFVPKVRFNNIPAWRRYETIKWSLLWIRLTQILESLWSLLNTKELSRFYKMHLTQWGEWRIYASVN